MAEIFFSKHYNKNGSLDPLLDAESRGDVEIFISGQNFEISVFLCGILVQFCQNLSKKVFLPCDL